MAKISDQISETLDEYVILPGWINARPDEVSLETKIGENITLQYPYATARMQCIVGPKLAVGAGRSGILTLVPGSLRDEDKQEILDENKKARLKKGDISYVTDPVHAQPEKPFEEVVKLVEKTGYSVIPIYDRFSKLYGFYIHDPAKQHWVMPGTPISELTVPLKKRGKEKGIPFLYNANKKEIKKILSEEKRTFIPIVNEDMILQKLAFLQKYDTNFIGQTITTKDNWEEELKKWGSQSDIIPIDSSNACFDDAIEIMKKSKKMYPDKPFAIGNITRRDHFNKFADAYKDLVKSKGMNPIGGILIIGGMALGTICQTGDERGNARGNFTVAKELGQARDKYFKDNDIYINVAIDGGVGTVRQILVGLGWCDLVVMGNYFNRLYEAAARKFSDKEGKYEVKDEASIKFIETWGEGDPIATYVSMFGINFREVLEKAKANPKAIEKVLERYKTKISTATIEGVHGTVEYRGRLKPCVENDARYIRATISNTGASNLKEYMEKVIFEKASESTLEKIKPHSIIMTENNK